MTSSLPWLTRGRPRMLATRQEMLPAGRTRWSCRPRRTCGQAMPQPRGRLFGRRSAAPISWSALHAGRVDAMLVAAGGNTQRSARMLESVSADASRSSFVIEIAECGLARGRVLEQAGKKSRGARALRRHRLEKRQEARDAAAP